jgi:hypothetical protein
MCMSAEDWLPKSKVLSRPIDGLAFDFQSGAAPPLFSCHAGGDTAVQTSYGGDFLGLVKPGYLHQSDRRMM